MPIGPTDDVRGVDSSGEGVRETEEAGEIDETADWGGGGLHWGDEDLH